MGLLGNTPRDVGDLVEAVSGGEISRDKVVEPDRPLGDVPKGEREFIVEEVDRALDGKISESLKGGQNQESS